MENPFKSKKFVYAVTYIMFVLTMAILPSFLLWINAEVDPATIDMIKDNLPYAFAAIGFVLGGHTLSDAISLSKGYQVPDDWKETVDDPQND